MVSCIQSLVHGEHKKRTEEESVGSEIVHVSAFGLFV